VHLASRARSSDVPSLSQHLLPNGRHGGEAYSRATHARLNLLLLQPPSAATATDIREAIRCVRLLPHLAQLGGCGG